MSAGGGEAPARRLLARLTELVAAFGGLLLLVAMFVTVASVVSAAVARPILGDSEIVQVCVGVAVACFMPYCHLHHGHIVIDVFTAWAPKRVRDALDAAMALVFLLVVAVLAWRVLQGGFDAYERGRRTMFLEIPLWWGYVGIGAAFVIWVAVALYMAWERVVDPDAARS